MATALTQKQTARRDRVIKAAMELAAEGGYEAVQMRDVAARARVALGTLYRYFPSKNQLLVAALGEWVGELQQRLAQRPPRGETPADRVVDVVRRAARALEREPKLTAAFVAALSSLDAEDDPRSVEYARAVGHTIAEIITGAAHDGEVPNREAVVMILSHVWFSSVVARIRGWAPPGQLEQDLETTVRKLLPGS